MFSMCAMHITTNTITFHMYHSMYATHLNNTYTHMHITATAIIFHMYHSMYATHLNYTYTHIHITSQAIDRMMKTL